MKINELLLLSGNDIPFYAAMIVVHIPTISEISRIGEENFFKGIHFLLVDKDDLESADKSDLEGLSNFDIFMSVMNSKESTKHKTDALQVLTLMFPNVNFKIEKDKILLQQENIDVESSINKLNFGEFQELICQIYGLAENGTKKEYDPEDGYAAKIAKKFEDRQKKLSKLKNDGEVKINFLMRQVSILAVGLQKDMNSLLNYTVYQLNDEYKRFKLKENFDVYIQAKMAGASDLEEVTNWMEDIHS